MRKSRFSVEQITYGLKQIETGIASYLHCLHDASFAGREECQAESASLKGKTISELRRCLQRRCVDPGRTPRWAMNMSLVAAAQMSTSARLRAVSETCLPIAASVAT
jgi:hypothetical protein